MTETEREAFRRMQINDQMTHIYEKLGQLEARSRNPQDCPIGYQISSIQKTIIELKRTQDMQAGAMYLLGFVGFGWVLTWIKNVFQK